MSSGTLSDSGEAMGAAESFFGEILGSEFESESSMWHKTISDATALGSVDQVGVMMAETMAALASAGFEAVEVVATGALEVDTAGFTGGGGLAGGVVTWVFGWMWIMGGLLGLVGLGKVNGSQKTTPLEALLLAVPLLGIPSISDVDSLSLVERMELCETPVECDFEIKLAAEGVAACSTGRPMTGLEGTKGRVDDLGMEGFLSSLEGDVEPPHGNVLVLDKNGMLAVTAALWGLDGEFLWAVTSLALLASAMMDLTSS